MDGWGFAEQAHISLSSSDILRDFSTASGAVTERITHSVRQSGRANEVRVRCAMQFLVDGGDIGGQPCQELTELRGHLCHELGENPSWLVKSRRFLS